jgi:KDO2-lipid IV(A) lauroyltransferase
VRFDDTERVAAALRGQRRVLILSAHHANWEWLLLRCSTGFEAPLTAVYRPLFDARLDRYARSVRQRFGCTMVRTDAIVQHLLERRGGVRLLAMLADQSPAVTSEQQAWPQFFGQPTAFHRGPGWIASKLDYAPYFAAMRRERRGHYVVDLVALSPGGQPAGPDVVVEAYVRALEAHVRRHPEQYFWAYNRWKREKPLYA